MTANPNTPPAKKAPAKRAAKKAEIKKEKVTATEEMRQLAAAVTKARNAGREWKSYETEARDRLMDLTEDKTNIEIVTEAGDIVATVTESAPRQSIDWAAFQADHPDLDYDRYRKTSDGTVTLRTSWVEQTG